MRESRSEYSSNGVPSELLAQDEQVSHAADLFNAKLRKLRRVDKAVHACLLHLHAIFVLARLSASIGGKQRAELFKNPALFCHSVCLLLDPLGIVGIA